MRKRKHTRVLVALAGAIAAVALMAPGATAATPAPGYEQFTGCPSPEENPAVFACTHAVIKGGNFQIGSKDVPIENPFNLTGGLLPDGHITANAEGGLEPVKQQVPGGIIGITGLDWLINFLHLEALKLYAVTELAGAPELGFTSFTLPIRVRLINPILGDNCYVGSFAEPIVLDLITATTDPPPPNEPITGVNPEFSFDPETLIQSQKNGQFVDNSFAAPAASGCVLTLFGFIPINVDGLVNSQSDLPSPAGTNETRQDFDLEVVQPSVVYP